MLAILSLCTAPLAQGQTQLEMNGQAAEGLREADDELNTTYRKLLEEYAGDEAFIASLKEAQRCWVAFRDAQLQMKYPEREPGYYGSIQPMCEADYLAELTQERTAALKVWLEGVEEGDACAGSVKTKEQTGAGESPE
ncbi:MAG: DUF1311 domain-containing protein [Chthoniobacterales bacterium]|nr:DUF1311 domain-containing protein [Chthoniobacterales bacterium]